jgi:trimethylamine--corrinoid protein Co-methyltransferase
MQRRARRESLSTAQRSAFQPLVSSWRPLEVVTPEQLERIHDASMRILENTGIELLDDEALNLFASAGAQVNKATKRVKIDRGLLREKISSAPSSFTLYARNPEKNIVIGGDHIVFSPVGGQAFSTNFERGRRAGTLADLEELIKLIHSFNVLHHGSDTPVEPTDLPAETRHLDAQYAMLRLTDKTIMGPSRGRVTTTDAIDMMSLVLGGRDALTDKPALITIINVNSPLRYDDWMLGGLMTYARAGQANVVTPFVAAGAMGPITMAGALAQQNAEALVGVMLTQIVRPGAPVVYGNFTVDTHMRSGSPSFGTPESAWATFVAGQLARRYNLPYRGNGSLASSNAPDAQAATETMMSLWSAVLARTNFVYQGAGWVEGGLTTSYEKFILDVEALSMMENLIRGYDVNDDTLALPFIDRVGPGGHHFDTEHTLARYANAFYEPLVSSRQSYGNWVDGGSLDAAQRAHRKWKEILRGYEQPALDIAIDEALRDFIGRRKREQEGKPLTA